MFARYDLAAAGEVTAQDWAAREPGLWKYRELLPVQSEEHIVSIGEIRTPALRLAENTGSAQLDLFLKDDGRLPTGSFKARGMTVALSRAVELGARSFFVPSAGNAGLALAAYGARGHVPTTVYLPQSTSRIFVEECLRFGARVVETPGTITDAGKIARQQERNSGSFDLSTLREPYRVEGKKTMAFELFEQFGADHLPDAILYPTGGGTGLVGMFKGFQELQSMGWLGRIPRLYAIQSEGCAPIVQAYLENKVSVTEWPDPRTLAPGLLVPSPFAAQRILESIRGSNGGAIGVTDSSIIKAGRYLMAEYGISVSPEAAAPFAALDALVRSGAIGAKERILLYGTGNGQTTRWSELEAQIGWSERAHTA